MIELLLEAGIGLLGGVDLRLQPGARKLQFADGRFARGQLVPNLGQILAHGLQPLRQCLFLRAQPRGLLVGFAGVAFCPLFLGAQLLDLLAHGAQFCGQLNDSRVHRREAGPCLETRRYREETLRGTHLEAPPKDKPLKRVAGR